MVQDLIARPSVALVNLRIGVHVPHDVTRETDVETLLPDTDLYGVIVVH
jgi:hypothetical protein